MAQERAPKTGLDTGLDTGLGRGRRVGVVVPAHDEEAVIGRLLRRLEAGDPDGRLEVVVVANGCSDGTAGEARRAAPRARVVEIPTASKIAALNAGDAALTTFPRAYVDADTEVDAAALLALADLLDGPEPAVGAPRLVVDTAGASLLSRAYHRVWRHTPYVSSGPLGCGVYMLNRAARERFEEFPDVIADDLWIDRTAPGRRIVDERHTFVFHAPRTARALLARLTRATLGNLQLEQRLGLAAGTPGRGGLLGEVARHPSLWPVFPVYVVLRLVAGRRAGRALREGRLTWLRDDSARRGHPASDRPTVD